MGWALLALGWALLGSVIGYIVGWEHAHWTIGTECQRLGKFYVGDTTYECTAIKHHDSESR